MMHAKYRFGTVALLTALSGMAPAADLPKDVPLQPPVVVTATWIPPEAISLPVFGVIQGGVGPVLLDRAFMTFNTSPSAIADKNKDPCDSTGKPILPQTGTKVETYPVFAMPGEMGLKYVLYYNTAAYPEHWTNNLQYWLDTDCSAQVNNSGRCNQTIAHFPDGSTLLFGGGPNGTVYTEEFDNGQSVASPVVAMTRDTTTGNYTLQDEDATTEVFSSTGALLSIKDASGIGWSFSSSGSTTTVTHTNGQSFTITAGPLYQGEQNGEAVLNQVVTVSDPANNAYTLDYGNQYSPNASGGDLDSISFPGTPATVISFNYTSIPNADVGDELSEVDYNGTPYAYTTYVTTTNSFYYGWANSTSLADGSELDSVAYVPNSAGNLVATLTNPLGHVSTHTYAGINGQLSSIGDNAVQDCGATESSRTYDANGNLSQTVDNNGNVHTYNYAANGQLQTETEASGTSQARTTNYVWDPNLQLNRLTSVTVVGYSQTTYTYNAQNRPASVAVTNLSANGTANQTLTTTYTYTLYANGMVHTMSVTSPSPNNSDTDVYTYDALGNLTSLANGLGQTTTYSNYNGLGEPQQIVGPNGDTTNLVYDARGRTQTKTTYPNGTAATWQYGYDGFGLLATESTPDNEIATWNRDAEMRLRTITHNDKDGASTETFGYDPNGDMASHVVTRGGVTSLAQNTLYDALGRVYQTQGQHGQTLTYGYDGNGNVLTVVDAVGHSTVNVYDHLDRLTQTTQSGGASPLMPSAAPTLSVPASSNSGDYTVSWTTVSGTTSYVLQEELNGGSWVTATATGSTSWTASSQPSGSYGYQVQACDATGCGPFSSVGTITVSIPTAPTSAPALTVPASSATGSYAVSWTGISGAASYNLQQRINSGSWTTVQASAATSWSAAGEASGSYAYQVQACNAVGCGPWSATGTTTVTLPPIPGVPALTVPANNGTGSYTVSWGSVSGASSYNLQQQVNGGSWTTAASLAATSWAASGKASGSYGYRIQSCNAGGCSGWSATATVVVTIPVPIAINGQTYKGSDTGGSNGGSSAEVGFEIVGSNSWGVFTAMPSSGPVMAASGTVPSGATTVQYTWTEVGLASGATLAGGTVTNGASSPMALSSNPVSDYYVAVGKTNTNIVGLTYQVTVTFYNAAGINISSSTCTMTAEAVSGE
jgi:YD repeat-containing protein